MCEQVCPHHCISIVQDKEGFLVPKIDQEKCVNCGLCAKKCPQNRTAELVSDVQQTLAARLKDDKTLYMSASGGAFAGLATAAIKDGWIVFGAAYDENMEVKHVKATTIDELTPLFNSKYVPVGQDQKQHVEIARDIAQYFNKKYGKSLMLPNPRISEEVATLTGLDGRKMSKSYNNVIPLFCSEKQLQKCVMSIKTDCAGANDPKDTNSILFTLYKLFATPEQIAAYEQAFHDGILWSEAKKQLFEVMNAYLSPMREKYEYYMAHHEEVDAILAQGAAKARPIAQETIHRIRKAIGVE